MGLWGQLALSALGLAFLVYIWEARLIAEHLFTCMDEVFFDWRGSEHPRE